MTVCEDMQRLFGNRVFKLRTAKGWSQEQFAARCGIQSRKLQKIERGEVVVTLSIVVQIARKLEITASELCDGIV